MWPVAAPLNLTEAKILNYKEVRVLAALLTQRRRETKSTPK